MPGRGHAAKGADIRKNLALGALLGLVLVAVLGVQAARLRSADVHSHREIARLLHDLRQVDAGWNAAVRRARSGLEGVADDVAHPAPLLASLDAALRYRGDGPWGPREGRCELVMPLLDDLKRSMDRKGSLVDRFVKQSGVLRSASRALPVAADDVIEGLREVAPAARATAAQAVGEVLAGTLRYVETSDTAAGGRVLENLSRLQALATGLPADGAGRIARFAAQAGTVMRQQQLGTRTLAELAALPTAKAIEALARAHAAEHERLRLAQQEDLALLVACAALLLLVLAGADVTRRWEPAPRPRIG